MNNKNREKSSIEEINSILEQQAKQQQHQVMNQNRTEGPSPDVKVKKV